MSTKPSAENQPQDTAAAIEPGFEFVAQAFWEKNRRLILLVCIAGLLAIIGREGWQYFAARREAGVRNDYAKTGDRPEQLGAFAGANAGHALAGVAYLRLADLKYSAGDFRAAGENYAKASSSLTNSALQGRARLGAAMCQLNAADRAAGETALKAISSDTTLPKQTRAEAAYHLATLAYEAGNVAEVSRLVAEVDKIDPASGWSQRATAMLTLQTAP